MYQNHADSTAPTIGNMSQVTQIIQIIQISNTSALRDLDHRVICRWSVQGVLIYEKNIHELEDEKETLRESYTVELGLDCGDLRLSATRALRGTAQGSG